VKSEHLNIANLEVAKGLVVRADTSKLQFIQVTASTTNIKDGIDLTWYNVSDDGTTASESFATAKIICGNATESLNSWVPMAPFIESRIDALESMAREGLASRFSRDMAYTLFASNLVDYADKYRGMHSVVMHEYEGFADIKLTMENSGVWTVPPHFIDSVAHLAGFIMNVSDTHDTANNFCVTPGWRSMRLAQPLEAGAEYRSYVKMIPSQHDQSVFFGDVYVMRKGSIVGMVGGIKFRRYPRILLDRFFSAPDSSTAKSYAATQAPQKALLPKRIPSALAPSDGKRLAKSHQAESPKPPHTDPSTISDFSSEPAQSDTPMTDQCSEKVAPAAEDPESITAKATALIASQTGIDLADLTDEARFSDIGVDSLMSLVIAEGFRRELGVTVNSSLFLEYPSMGALKGWLQEYYN
jgi:monodictyphenone polyketide synthase